MGDVKTHIWEIILVIAIIAQVSILEYSGFDKKNQIEIEHLNKAFLRIKINKKWDQLQKWDPVFVDQRHKQQIMSFYKKNNPKEIQLFYKEFAMAEIGRQVALAKIRARKKFTFSFINKIMDKEFDRDYDKMSSRNLSNRLWRIFSRYVYQFCE